MKRHIVILIIFISAKMLFADNTFPVSYSIMEYLEGGEVIVTEDPANSSEPISYFIKPNWTEEAEALYEWRGLKRQNAKGKSLGSAYVVSSYPIGSKILTLWKEDKRFFLAVIDTNLSIEHVSELNGNWNPYFRTFTEWLGKTGKNEIGLLLNQTLLLCKYDRKTGIEIRTISENVIKAASLYDNKTKGKYRVVYLVYRDGNGIVNFLTEDYQEDFSSRIPIAEDIFIQKLKERAALISYSKSYPNSLVKFVDADKGIVSETWIETSGDKIKMEYVDNRGYIYYLQSNNQQYFLKIEEFSNSHSQKKSFSVEVLSSLIEPIAFEIIEDDIIAVFRNGLVTFSKTGEIHSIDFFPFGEYFTNTIKITRINSSLILSSATNSMVLEQKEHQLWFFNRFIKSSGRILLPVSLIIIIIFLFVFYRRQKTFLEAVLNLPASGAVFIIDKYGRLTRANSSGKKLLGITDSIPMRRMFRFYCEMGHTRPMSELVEKAITTRDTFTQKLNIVKENDMYEWIFNVIALRNATGVYKGFVLTGIDITEQLERKRLSNWAQLAHDMQTNLSTIRLNAEQMELDEEGNNFKRRKKIIHQVGLLIQRVRDVVTVGRSDTINKELVDAFEICHEVRNEFDEALFPHVTFHVEVEHYNLRCDKPKTIRAVRNAVENGIKSMQGKPGSIKITNWNDAKYAYIGVEDTGPGMDEATKKKMLTPYFTTAKKSGGAGIGTMIMQHVMELHGGEIQVKSEKGRGTQIIFCIPNYAHNRTTRAIADKLSSLKAERK